MNLKELIEQAKRLPLDDDKPEYGALVLNKEASKNSGKLRPKTKREREAGCL